MDMEDNHRYVLTNKEVHMDKIRYILFALRFLWENKAYPTNRNKFRRMDREYKKKYK